MTVMTTSSRELDINTLVLTAYQYAGIINEVQTASGPQWDARSSYGRRQLEIMIDVLAAEGIFARSMEMYDLTVLAGAQRTELPADTVDLRGAAHLVQTANGEFPLTVDTREGYFGIAMPDQTGTPARVFLERTAPMYLYVWPVPVVDCVIRVQRQRMTFDASQGAATVDLERFWMDYLVHELASRLALTNGLPMDRVALLAAKAAAAKNLAKGKSSSQLSNRMVVNHPGPHRRW